MSGDRLLIGALDSQGKGSAKIYMRNAFMWVPDVNLKTPVGVNTSNLAKGAGIDAQHAIVGIPESTVVGANSSGGVLIYPASSNFAFQAHGVGCAGSGGFVPSLALTGCSTPGGNSNAGGFRWARRLNCRDRFRSYTSRYPIGDGCSLFLTPLLPSLLLLPLSPGTDGQGAITISSALPLNLAAPAAFELQGFSAGPGPGSGVHDD
jgi:hypothetical protein